MHNASSSILMHSKYNPQQEATKFLDAQNISFVPSYIIVSEPGESYLAVILRKRYPTTTLIALRYTPDLFSDTDSLWDAIWRPQTGLDVSRFLLHAIPEEYLSRTIFIAWKPSDTIWPECAHIVWNGIASVIKEQTSIMHTRNHFGKRWFTNMIKNAIHISNPVFPLTTNKPIFLAAAGPSLEKQFPFEHQNFFVCAVSSSLRSLHAHACVPDICISTDGGYWALPLFRNLDSSVPVAFPLEAAIPITLLESNPVLLLNYGSELENVLFSILGVSGEKVFRNGTVVGTAVQYVLSLTDKPVYISGLDLQATHSFTHARPHESDQSISSISDRFHPISAMLYSRNLETASLEIYRSWFSSRDAVFKKRCVRLLPEGNPIPGFQSISIHEVQTLITSNNERKTIQSRNIPDKNSRKILISEWLQGIAQEFQVYADIQSFNDNRSQFFSSFFCKQLCIEIMQMVSFTDYLKLIKKIGEVSTLDEVPQTASTLCKKTVDFLIKLSVMVLKYE